MAMHHRDRFDGADLLLGSFDYSSVLRSVLRHAVGCALASSLAATGCSDARSLAADGGGTQARTVAPPDLPRTNLAATGVSEVPAPEAMLLAGAPAPSPNGSGAPTPDTKGRGSGGMGPVAAPPARPTPIALDCSSGVPQLFAGITAQARDAAAFLVQPAGTEVPQLFFTKGVLCANATDAAVCQAKVERAMDKAGLPLTDNCGPMYGPCTQYVITTQADELRKYQSRAELLEFLGPIDSPADALLLLYYERRGVSCGNTETSWIVPGFDPASIVERSDGYEVTWRSESQGCGGWVRERVTLHVATDGTVTEIAREASNGTTACVGRRPAGLLSRHAVEGRSALGEHFAQMAHLEHASIAAFEVLVTELEHHCAPAELIAAARSAAADEMRHAAMTSALASAFGATPRVSEVAPAAPRSLEAIAVENAAEGCVRECFGAALGSYQAQRALNPAIAFAMSEIAEDETRHAALALAVDAWAQTRLDEAARASVSEARAQAVRQLKCELARAPDPSIAFELGLPDPATALRLCSELEQALWLS